MFTMMLQFHCFLNRALNSFFFFFCLAGSAYRECMDNGTWALKSNYSNCEPILEEKVRVASWEQSCCVLHSANNLLTISDKCSSEFPIITLMAHGEKQSDIVNEMQCFDCLTLIELHFLFLHCAVKIKQVWSVSP